MEANQQVCFGKTLDIAADCLDGDVQRAGQGFKAAGSRVLQAVEQLDLARIGMHGIHLHHDRHTVQRKKRKES